MNSKQNQSLALVQFSYLASCGIFFNFLVLYMSANGYSVIECGLAQALTAGVNLVLQPVMGYVTDRFISFKKIFVIGTLLASVTIFLLPLTIGYVFFAMIAIVLQSVLVKQFPTLIDAWSVAIREKNSHINYGLTRGLGSLGEGIAALAFGYLITRFGYGVMFFGHSACLMIAVLASLSLQNIHPILKKVEKSSVKSQNSIQQLLRNRSYLFFLTSVVLMNIGLKIISIFSSLIVKNLGGDAKNFGVVMFVCGLFELPTFIIVSKLAQRMERKKLYLIALTLFVVGGSIAVTATNLPAFLVGRTLTSMTYAVYVCVLVEYVSTLVHLSVRTMAMTTISGIAGGGAHIVSSFLGGALLDNRPALLVVLAILMLLSVLAFLPNLRKTG